MRTSHVCRLAAFLLATASLTIPSLTASAQQNQPPHAWLFGTWTGGLFPVASNISAEACLATPVVIFTRDVVLRATLTETTYEQRVIETARTNPGETEFRFSPGPASSASALLGTVGSAPPSGFGCEDPNVLHVRRRGDNEIAFPGCRDFPNPLVRCPTR
jgi:hypothetical protein